MKIKIQIIKKDMVEKIYENLYFLSGYGRIRMQLSSNYNISIVEDINIL